MVQPIKSFTISLPRPLYDKIKEDADKNKRSKTKHIELILEELYRSKDTSIPAIENKQVENNLLTTNA